MEYRIGEFRDEWEIEEEVEWGVEKSWEGESLGEEQRKGLEIKRN